MKNQIAKKKKKKLKSEISLELHAIQYDNY